MHAGIIDGSLTRRLRHDVLRPELPIDAALPGDDEAGVIHFGIIDPAGAALSTCLLFPEPCPWQPAPGPGWHLRQMATAPVARGQGLASQVLAAVVHYIASQGGGVLWCNARELAVPMYERGGLIGEGDIFTDEVHTIPHLRMWCSIAAAVGETHEERQVHR